MNYNETLAWLYDRLPMFHRIGMAAYKADLHNITALEEMLGNPHEHLRMIHIAGTNGKGSVSHMVASVLQRAGYRTGLYTSPHLKDFRERIRVDGRMIPKKTVSRFIGGYRTQFEPVRPSFFELTLAMAFDHFRRENTDIAVIEVGLGGRLDSTNIIRPELSVITNISWDHVQFLGDTLEKIAAEKAGIIKEGIPVVIGETQPETAPVFQRFASEKGSDILFADQLYTLSGYRETGTSGNLAEAEISGPGLPDPFFLHTPLRGFYQKKNLVTAAAVCTTLNRLGYRLTPDTIRDGIREVTARTGLAGRWQVLGKDPLIICDTGHNEGGMREVLAQIRATPHNKLHFVLGMVSDKDLSAILSMLPSQATYYFCRPAIPRGMDARLLQENASGFGLHGQIYPSVRSAFQSARRKAEKGDLVFVGGSTFVVAEVV